MSAAARAAAWLAALTPRERGLLAAAAGAALAALLVAAALAVREDLAVRRARVAGGERALAEVRRLAALLRQAAPHADGPSSPPLLGRLEAAAAAVVGRERIAGMTPAVTSAGDGTTEERVELRVGGASLAEVVRLLHVLESGDAPLPVARLALRKHPDDPGRFEATLEVVRLRPGSEP